MLLMCSIPRGVFPVASSPFHQHGCEGTRSNYFALNTWNKRERRDGTWDMEHFVEQGHINSLAGERYLILGGSLPSEKTSVYPSC